MIDVIIPAYNSQKTIEQTLFSLSIQENTRDLNVYIVNDGSAKDYSSSIKFFKKFMNITELKLKENKGPGYARQYGVDHSDGKYIIFVDSDDSIFDCYSLSTLKKAIESDNYDLVISDFLEEREGTLYLHEKETIFIHGKLYKREFLEKNNIRFNDSRYDEDNGFNQLLLFHLPKIKYLDEPTIIWKKNMSSITRKEVDFATVGLSSYIYNITWACNEGLKRKLDIKKISELAFTTILSIYYYYLIYKDKNLIKELKELYSIYLKYPIKQPMMNRLIEEQFYYSMNFCPKEVLINPSITFNDFLQLVDKEGVTK